MSPSPEPVVEPRVDFEEARLAEIQERANHQNHGGWVNRPRTAHEDVSWLLAHGIPLEVIEALSPAMEMD
jgi:hypothetical protein